MYAGILRLD